MRMPSPIFALVLIGQQHLCGCAQLGTVRPEELLLISPGISLGEARTRLGENNLHHHFTVERDGHVWRLFRCLGIFSRGAIGRCGSFCSSGMGGSMQSIMAHPTWGDVRTRGGWSLHPGKMSG